MTESPDTKARPDAEPEFTCTAQGGPIIPGRASLLGSRGSPHGRASPRALPVSGPVPLDAPGERQARIIQKRVAPVYPPTTLNVYGPNIAEPDTVNRRHLRGHGATLFRLPLS